VDEILGEARRPRVDLVVMATHGRHGPRRAQLGSVTEAVLEQSPIPVVVVRPGHQQPRLTGTLLVPVDGSPGAATALPVARSLARATAARVLLLQVITPLVRYGRGRYIEPHFEERARAAAEVELEALAAEFRQVGVPTEVRAVVGPIVPSIVALAAEAGADLIVMGTHAATGVRRAVLGSVADEVVRKATQPVLLVRCNEQPAGRAGQPAVAERAVDLASPGWK
jgi:nucleotide-binding universal stress UspA family protein